MMDKYSNIKSIAAFVGGSVVCDMGVILGISAICGGVSFISKNAAMYIAIAIGIAIVSLSTCAVCFASGQADEDYGIK